MKIIIVSYEAYGNIDFHELSNQAVFAGYEVDYHCSEIKIGIIPNVKIKTYIHNKWYYKFSVLYALFMFFKLLRSSKKKSFIHVRYFFGCSLLSSLKFFGYNVCCDVRSGCVGNSKLYNIFRNYITAFELKCFAKISVISSPVAKNVFNLKKFKVLRIGSNSFPENKFKLKKLKYNSPLKFVYIGTLVNRDISFFANNFNEIIFKHGLNYTLDIYGGGDENESKLLRELSKMSKIVSFKGFLERDVFSEVISQYDIGVSYIPILDKFDYQPPTKTFEYLLNGLPSLATSTSANKNIIKHGLNGWLISDTYDSLDKFLTSSIEFIDGVSCVKSCSSHTWESIFEYDYLKLID